jgi:hypothetical protein
VFQVSQSPKLHVASETVENYTVTSTYKQQKLGGSAPLRSSTNDFGVRFRMAIKKMCKDDMAKGFWLEAVLNQHK